MNYSENYHSKKSRLVLKSFEMRTININNYQAM